jgi:hypothetical protein
VKRGAGDGADSPTRATKKTAALFKVLLFFLCAKRLAQKNFASQNSIKNEELKIKN